MDCLGGRKHSPFEKAPAAHVQHFLQKRIPSSSLEGFLTACISGWSQGCSASDCKKVKKAARRTEKTAENSLTQGHRGRLRPSDNGLFSTTALRLVNSKQTPHDWWGMRCFIYMCTTVMFALLLPGRPKYSNAPSS